MKIHLCCGPNDMMPGWINVDAVNFGQEVTADLGKPWLFAADGKAEEIYCKDGFEHMESVEHFLRESARVLMVGGTLKIWVPHVKNPSSCRITHKTYYTWNCFSVYPEPHDSTQSLRVVSNRIYIGHKDSVLWKPVHALINVFPKWWERVGYVSNIEVVFQKVQGSS